MRIPFDVTEAIIEYSGFDPVHAAEEDATVSDIREYFTGTNFRAMFGAEQEWLKSYPYEEMAHRAVVMVMDAVNEMEGSAK